jgi:transposase
MLFSSFTSACISVLVILLGDSPQERMGTWKTFNFERGQIVGASLAGASVIKTATLSCVSRATVSKLMSAYTNRGKTTSAKKMSGRKSSLTERNCRKLRRIVSKNHQLLKYR